MSSRSAVLSNDLVALRYQRKLCKGPWQCAQCTGRPPLCVYLCASDALFMDTSHSTWLCSWAAVNRRGVFTSSREQTGSVHRQPWTGGECSQTENRRGVFTDRREQAGSVHRQPWRGGVCSQAENRRGVFTGREQAGSVHRQRTGYWTFTATINWCWVIYMWIISHSRFGFCQLKAIRYL